MTQERVRLTSSSALPEIDLEEGQELLFDVPLDWKEAFWYYFKNQIIITHNTQDEIPLSNMWNRFQVWYHQTWGSIGPLVGSLSRFAISHLDIEHVLRRQIPEGVRLYQKGHKVYLLGVQWRTFEMQEVASIENRLIHQAEPKWRENVIRVLQRQTRYTDYINQELRSRVRILSWILIFIFVSSFLFDIIVLVSMPKST
jgi:hypothetical protein